jgi:asparagine N-glycosylation enzyme membrane subunit Stt3
MCTMKPSYWETVAIGWRILWQGIGGFVLAVFLGNLMVLGFLPELTRTGPSYWALAVPFVAASALSLFVVLPLVVKGLFTGAFKTFRLAVIRDESCQSTL